MSLSPIIWKFGGIEDFVWGIIWDAAPPRIPVTTRISPFFGLGDLNLNLHFLLLSLPETNSKFAPKNGMVGIRSFPIGEAYFQGQTCY